MILDTSTRWGVQGHGMVHREAAEHLPESMPDFFKHSVETLASLASQPDRWKVKGLDYLSGATRPDHYLAYERVKDKALPADRFAMVVEASKDGLSPAQVGLLPYRVAELYQNLTVDFAIWRNQADKAGLDAQQAQNNAIYDAGIIGHYVGDASQPMHTTIHSNGWRPEVPNPEGFRTTPGLHYEFEVKLVNGYVDEAKVADLVGPPKVLTGDPLQWALGMVAESNTQVVPLYRLEKSGALNPEHPSPEGVDFAEHCLARGAENLRNLWYSAWLDSEAVAKQIAQDPPV